MLGTGLCVFIALRTGSASGFFVPRAIQNAGLALAFLISIARQPPARRLDRRAALPLPGGLAPRPADPPRRSPRRRSRGSLLFTVRAIVYTVLILTDQEGALAGAVVVLGWPAFLGTLWFCYRYIPKPAQAAGNRPSARGRSARHLRVPIRRT